MANKVILPGNLVMLVIGMTMFMVLQTVPILARYPHPLGFGDSVIEATKIQIPFSIILLIFGPTSGFIISKMGSRTPMIAGTIITTIGFFAIYALHSTQLLVSIDLAIISIGLSFAAVRCNEHYNNGYTGSVNGHLYRNDKLDKNYRKCYWSCDCWNASAITARNSKRINE